MVNFATGLNVRDVVFVVVVVWFFFFFFFFRFVVACMMLRNISVHFCLYDEIMLK